MTTLLSSHFLYTFILKRIISPNKTNSMRNKIIIRFIVFFVFFCFLLVKEAISLMIIVTAIAINAIIEI